MSRSDPYTLFARVYDLPDHQEITRAFLKRAWPEIQRREKGTWVLDLACGTGLAASLMEKRGVPVLGVDRSRPMLRIARQRCGPGVRLVEQDLMRFRARERCSVATSCGDVMNHFPTVADLERVFQNVHRNLTEGGVLMFDSIRRFCYEHYWKDSTYHLEGDTGDVTMECDWDPSSQTATCRMIGYARNRTGTYSKFETTLVEYFHKRKAIAGALERAGFVVESEKWSPWDDQHREPDYDRLFWTARKA